eukprot:3291074-Pleurochrysis_carterae.AAC.2
MANSKKKPMLCGIGGCVLQCLLARVFPYASPCDSGMASLCMIPVTTTPLSLCLCSIQHAVLRVDALMHLCLLGRFCVCELIHACGCTGRAPAHLPARAPARAPAQAHTCTRIPTRPHARTPARPHARMRARAHAQSHMRNRACAIAHAQSHMRTRARACPCLLVC